MPSAPITTYNAALLQPAFPTELAPQMALAFGVSLALAKGALIAISSADGKAYPYDGTKVADPTAAPAASFTGSGAWEAGTYVVNYTYKTAAGESLASQSDLILEATGSKLMRIAAITSIPSGVTHVNVYVNGVFQKQITVTAGATAQTDFDPLATGSSYGLPNVSTGFTAIDDKHVAKGILAADLVTDSSGNVSFGDATPGEFGEEYTSAPVYVGGTFRTSDLEQSGDGAITNDAVADLGRLIAGDITDGLLRLI